VGCEKYEEDIRKRSFCSAYTQLTSISIPHQPHPTPPKQDQEQIGRFILAALENGPSLERDD